MRIDNAVLQFLENYFVKRRGDVAIDGSFVPAVTDAYLLGSYSARWDTIYARTVVAENLSVSASVGNADTVDGFHAYSTPQASSLLALDGTSVFPTSVYASALLVDGTRSLTGNLSVNAGITIDGVDISAHASNVDAHHARQHLIISGSDHTVTGNPFDLIGLNGINNLGVLTPSSSPGATEAILKTASDGSLVIGVSNMLNVDATNLRVGIGIAPVAGYMFQVQTPAEMVAMRLKHSSPVATSDLLQIQSATSDIWVRVNEYGNLGVGDAAEPADNIRIRAYTNLTDITGTKYGTYSTIVAAPTVNNTGVQLTPAYIGSTIGGTGGLSHTIDWYGQHIDLVVAHSSAQGNDTIGSYVSVSANSGLTPTITNVYGQYIYLNAEDGTFTNAYGIFIVPRVDQGNIATGYGIRISPSIAGAGTFTNLYGLKVENITAGTDAFAIHTSNGKVRFGDIVGIGADPITTSMLYVLKSLGDIAGSQSYANISAEYRWAATVNDATGYIRGGYIYTNNVGATAGINLGNIEGFHVKSAIAVNVGTLTRLQGGQFEVRADATGTITDLIGVSAYVDAQNSDVTNLYASIFGPKLGSTVVDATGSIGSYYGIYLTSPLKGAGSITSAYGLYVADITTGISNYSIYTGAGNVSLGANLAFRQASQITTSTGNLSLIPAGDVILDPTGKDVLPNNNYDLNLGSLSKKFLTLHAAELFVETLVAQSTLATIGGRILVGPTTKLTSDLSAGSTSILVEHNNLAVNDRILLESGGNLEFMAVTAGPTGTGPYGYTVTRNLDGSGANQWYAGDAVFNTGTTGDGWIDLYSYSGVLGVGTGPTIVGNVRNSATYNDWDEYWAIGNLNGLYNYGVDTYGVGLGRYGANHVVIDATNGIRFRDASNNVRVQLSSDALTLGYTSENHIILNTANGLRFMDTGAVVLGQLSSTTWTLGQTSSEHVSISSTNVDIKDGATVYTSLSGGSLTLGVTSQNHVILNSASGLRFLTGSAVVVGQLNGSTLTLGQTDENYITFDPTNGLRFMDSGAVVRAQFLADAFTIGDPAANYLKYSVADGIAIAVVPSSVYIDKDGISVGTGTRLTFDGTKSVWMYTSYDGTDDHFNIVAGTLATELISNTGFETDTTGWDLTAQSPNTIARSDTAERTGSYGVLASSTYNATPSTLSTSFITASSGNSYTFSVWVKEKDSPTYAYMRVTAKIWFYDSSDTYIGTSVISYYDHVKKGWQRLAMEGSAPPTTAKMKGIILIETTVDTTGSSTISIDDASMKLSVTNRTIDWSPTTLHTSSYMRATRFDVGNTGTGDVDEVGINFWNFGLGEVGGRIELWESVAGKWLEISTNQVDSTDVDIIISPTGVIKAQEEVQFANRIRFMASEAPPSTPASDNAVVYFNSNVGALIALDEYAIPLHIYNDYIVTYPLQSAYLTGPTLSLLNAYNLTLVFRDAQTDVAYWMHRISNPWVGRTFQVVIRWLTTTASPTGNVVWTVGLSRIRNGETYRTSETMTSGATVAAVGAQDTWVNTSFNFATSTNFENGDLIQLRIYRQGSHGSDTHTSSVRVGGVFAYLYAG